MERLKKIQAEAESHHPDQIDAASVVGLASAAPGGDILFHEACAELKIPSIMCLPIPAADYIGQTYDDYPEWRSRLQDLMERHDSVLELSDRAELPHWLAEPPANPPIDFWERGNRWVLAMALAYDSERSYLLALWDGVQSSAATGGTGHMVRLATATSEFRLERIDTNELVAQLQPA